MSNTKQQKIAICLTTRGRDKYLTRSLNGHKKYLPAGAVIFVVDDGSDKPKKLDGVQYHYIEKNVGIPRAKNKCLELADAWGADHIFLFDDDIYPVVKDWHKGYIDSPEAHLQYCWADIRPGEHGNAHYFSVGKRLYEDDKLFSFSHPRGQMLYIDAKKVLPRVGGFDPVYGKGMVEHVDWSWRIHNAGLSTWKNQDIVGSEQLFYSIDENANSELDHETTIDDTMRTVVDRNNQRILHAKGDSSEYIEYREDPPKPAATKPLKKQNNVVICGVYTGQPDFQIKWGERHSSVPNPAYTRTIGLEYAATLAASTEQHGQRLIVLNNIEDKVVGKTEYIKTGTSTDPYKNRFLKALHYLLAHPEIDNAWIVDSGDVTMLNNPFPAMEAGKIYVGCETTNKLDCQWLMLNTPNAYYRQWLRKRAGQTLLNCGLLGGSRQDVIDYLTKMFYIWGYNTSNMDLIDMLVFNAVGYENYADRLVYGVGKVNNQFKTMRPTLQRSEWWLHK
jgi:glycosyltransferase involved in cell wall biosynthesis